MSGFRPVLQDVRNFLEPLSPDASCPRSKAEQEAESACQLETAAAHFLAADSECRRAPIRCCHQMQTSDRDTDRQPGHPFRKSVVNSSTRQLLLLRMASQPPSLRTNDLFQRQPKRQLRSRPPAHSARRCLRFGQHPPPHHLPANAHHHHRIADETAAGTDLRSHGYLLAGINLLHQ